MFCCNWVPKLCIKQVTFLNNNVVRGVLLGFTLTWKFGELRRSEKSRAILLMFGGIWRVSWVVRLFCYFARFVWCILKNKMKNVENVIVTSEIVAGYYRHNRGEIGGFHFWIEWETGLRVFIYLYVNFVVLVLYCSAFWLYWINCR